MNDRVDETIETIDPKGSAMLVNQYEKTRDLYVRVGHTVLCEEVFTVTGRRTCLFLYNHDGVVELCKLVEATGGGVTKFTLGLTPNQAAALFANVPKPIVDATMETKRLFEIGAVGDAAVMLEHVLDLMEGRVAIR